jgi:membrane-associated protease RseP (regulator of RpoE activity)
VATFLGIVAFVLLLFFLIMFHEFGHFITARWAGIKVSKFFLGFGPTLWSFRRGREEKIPDPKDPTGGYIVRPETEYGIKPILVGGFVKVVGMSPAEEVPAEDEPRSFDAAPTWKRAIVLGAGSVTHFITAFIVLFLVFGVIGTPDEGRPTQIVGDIAGEVDGRPAPAAVAGLREGDRIVEIDNRPVDDWVDVRDGIRSNPGESVDLLVQRGDDRLDIEIEPLAIDESGQEVGVIGVLPRPEFPGRVHRDGPITSVNKSATLIKQLLVGGSTEDGSRVDGFFQALPRAFSPKNLGFTGEGPTNERPISVIGAGRVAVDFAAEGQIVAFLVLFAQLNIFVAVFNMLPLPPLDGGHLLILGIGKLRGRPVDPKTVLPVMAVVFSLLVILGILLIYYDIFSPVQVP